MTWIDNNGEVRPQSWEEYCEMVKNAPDWPTTHRLMKQFGVQSRILRSHERSVRRKEERLPPIRVRLFRADPHCFWCGVLTVLANNNYNELDLATVDHLYSKFHPERQKKHSSGTGVLHVLACRGCNQDRALCELRQEVFTPKLTDKIKFAELADATRARRTSVKTTAPVAANNDSGQVLTLNEEYKRGVLRFRRRPIQTMKEAIEFARENPSR